MKNIAKTVDNISSFSDDTSELLEKGDNAEKSYLLKHGFDI